MKNIWLFSQYVFIILDRILTLFLIVLSQLCWIKLHRWSFFDLKHLYQVQKYFSDQQWSTIEIFSHRSNFERHFKPNIDFICHFLSQLCWKKLQRWSFFSFESPISTKMLFWSITDNHWKFMSSFWSLKHRLRSKIWLFMSFFSQSYWIHF